MTKTPDLVLTALSSAVAECREAIRYTRSNNPEPADEFSIDQEDAVYLEVQSQLNMLRMEFPDRAEVLRRITQYLYRELANLATDVANPTTSWVANQARLIQLSVLGRLSNLILAEQD